MKANSSMDGFMGTVYFGDVTEWGMKANFEAVKYGA